jgi:hypothetical protein
MQESLTSMESRWLEYVKSQLSTFLCHLAQSSIFSGPIHQRPLPTTDSGFSTPLISSVQGKAFWFWKTIFLTSFPYTEQRVIFSTLAIWSWNTNLFRTFMTQCLWCYISGLPGYWVWFQQLPMVFGNLVSKFKFQVKITCSLPGNNSV